MDGCVPGGQVLLLVDEVQRAMTEETWTGRAVFDVGRPLADGDQLFCIQRLCSRSSDVEGNRVRVTKGRMKLTVTPGSVPGGNAASLVVGARDADTGADLTGLPVTLVGVPVGVTGVPFGWTAPTAGTSVGGAVAGGVAYADAGFSVALRQAIPLYLTLTPGPTLVPGQVFQTDVVWTIQPQWGAAAITVTGNTPVAMVPPPPNAGDRVLVSVSLKAHLQGLIGGIDWPPEVIPITGGLGYVALTKASHAMSGLFSYGAATVVTEDGTGYEDRLFARVNLAGVA